MKIVTRLRSLSVIVTVLVALLLSNSGATAILHHLVVRAGQSDRHNTVVTFKYGLNENHDIHLIDDAGNHFPLQFEGQMASFVLRDLKAGQQKSFYFARGKITDSKEHGAVWLKRAQNGLTIQVRDYQVLSFVAEPGSLPSPDIKPVFL